MITPEQRLTNLINYLLSQVDGPSYQGRMFSIASTIYQLAEEWDQYLAGKFQPIPNDSTEAK